MHNFTIADSFEISTISGFVTHIMLQDAEPPHLPHLFTWTGAPGSRPENRSIVSLGVIRPEANVVSESLREWVQANFDLDRYRDDPSDSIADFSTAIGDAIRTRDIACRWAAGDWFSMYRPAEFRFVGKCGGIEEWAEGEVVVALREGVHLDVEECADLMRQWVREAFAGLTDPVLVEVMPLYLRASHAAAGNRGEYPANGAERYVITRNEVEDDDEWTTVIRDAVADDLIDYGFHRA
jgi:hypothetical protein